MTRSELGNGERSLLRTFGRELALLVALYAGLKTLFMFVVYPMIGWQTNAPTPAVSVILTLVIIWMARTRGESLAAFGLARPRRIWLAVVLALVFLVAQAFAFQPIRDLLREAVSAPAADISSLSHIHGNLVAYLGWLVIAWVAAGFCEEFIFRGYLMNRIAALGRGTVLAWSFAIIMQAVLFGLVHLWAGPASLLTAGFGGLVYGVFFLIAGRNLWALILYHGIWNSAGVTLIYLNGVPSTS